VKKVADIAFGIPVEMSLYGKLSESREGGYLNFQ
jgi:hypothetical protein